MNSLGPHVPPTPQPPARHTTYLSTDEPVTISVGEAVGDGGWCAVPRKVVSEWMPLMCGPGGCPAAVRLYLLLCARNYARPSAEGVWMVKVAHERVEQAAAMSKTTRNRATDWLTEHGLIECDRTAKSEATYTIIRPVPSPGSTPGSLPGSPPGSSTDRPTHGSQSPDRPTSGSQTTDRPTHGSQAPIDPPTGRNGVLSEESTHQRVGAEPPVGRKAPDRPASGSQMPPTLEKERNVETRDAAVDFDFDVDQALTAEGFPPDDPIRTHRRATPDQVRVALTSCDYVEQAGRLSRTRRSYIAASIAGGWGPDRAMLAAQEQQAEQADEAAAKAAEATRSALATARAWDALSDEQRRAAIEHAMQRSSPVERADFEATPDHPQLIARALGIARLRGWGVWAIADRYQPAGRGERS